MKMENRRAKFEYDRREVIEIFGIYAHKNKTNGKIFYVGQQRKTTFGNIRAYTFYENRSERYIEYVNKIGKENIEVIWLYETNDENESLYKLEKKFQEIYYSIYQDDFLTNELILQKENNPNYGKFWTDEKRKKLSEKKKVLKATVGDKNGMARRCVLYGPDGEEHHFTTLKEMREWFKVNVVDGDTIWPPENEYKNKNIKFVQKNKIEAFKKAIGWYYKKM